MTVRIVLHERKPETADMKYVMHVRKIFILYEHINIRKKRTEYINIYNLNSVIIYCRCKSTQNLLRMNDARIPKRV